MSQEPAERSPRRRALRVEQWVLIGLAIVEALVIFGAVVPALLKQSRAGAHPPSSQEVSDG
jgi:hypothetical protein